MSKTDKKVQIEKKVDSALKWVRNQKNSTAIIITALAVNNVIFYLLGVYGGHIRHYFQDLLH